MRSLRKAIQLSEHKERPHLKEPQEERSGGRADDVIGKQFFCNKLVTLNTLLYLGMDGRPSNKYIIGHPLIMDSVQEMTGVS